MTTSNRLDFRVADLRKNIHDRYARDIAAADAVLAKENSLDERIAAWREEQERRVRSLVSQLRRGNVSDRELANFSIRSMPSSGWRPEERHADEIERATNRRDDALRRLDAIRAHTPAGETEPVLSLTPRMATDWFGI